VILRYLLTPSLTTKCIVKKRGGDKFWPAKNEEAKAIWMDCKVGFYLALAGEGAKAWTVDVWCIIQDT
jgi:hypothetical protein